MSTPPFEQANHKLTPSPSPQPRTSLPDPLPPRLLPPHRRPLGPRTHGLHPPLRTSAPLRIPRPSPRVQTLMVLPINIIISSSAIRHVALAAHARRRDHPRPGMVPDRGEIRC